ncbi:MAG TPA: DUF6677 family protein [Thermoanaerobaculia bacterium]|nr:DUF6677 family protein [Thermoanaerobaculia bacterium]
MSKRSITAMVLAFVVPGAGHFYLGYRARAAIFFMIVLILFVIGLSIDGSLYTLSESGGALLKILASLGSMGSGALYFIARVMPAPGEPSYAWYPMYLIMRTFSPHPDVTSMTYEYGTTFTLTAGLMNLLLVLDCFDIAEGRKR